MVSTSSKNSKQLRKMHLQIIPFQTVESDITASTTTPSQSTHSTANFNSSLHAHTSISTLIPESPAFQHTNPPWDPYAYSLWLPLISKSQHLPTSHQFPIPTFLYEDLRGCHWSWVRYGNVDRNLLDDLIEIWLSTKVGKQIKTFFEENKAWFVRLDQNSPKDSELMPRPVRSMRDVIKKIVSSWRAMGGLEREATEAMKHNRETITMITLTPWNASMDPGKEFRVFVPPVAVSGGVVGGEWKPRVAAISQYEWPKSSGLAETVEVEQAAEMTRKGAEGILGEIVRHAREVLAPEMREMLVRAGFTFDVSLQVVEGRWDVQLIELNPFGAMSGCGSCLFHWSGDARLLYGLEEEVVFRVTI